MVWTETTLVKYGRVELRYASDSTDEEWAVISEFLPPVHRRGRPTKVELRCVVDVIFYIVQSGCQWRMLPRDFPPYTTVQSYFYRWRDSGLWGTINHHLVMRAREAAGREASPTADVIYSQSVKTTEAGRSCGFDAGKKIKGRKRHIITDTNGLLAGAVVHKADIQDRDGAVLVAEAIRSSHPWLRHIFADSAYAGEKLASALALMGEWTIEIIKRSDAAKGFVLLPRRWVVDRTFGWLNRSRRLAKNVEKLISSATAWLMVASVKVVMRRLARG